MSCRHPDPKNNPECSSYRTPARQVAEAEEALAGLRKKFKLPDSPDAENFEIEEITEVEHCLVVKVKYPNCAACAYEGHKVMVFADVTIKDAIKWRTIDPHFRDDKVTSPKHAPSPIARFPATKEGWQDALIYANNRDKPHAR